MQLTTAVAAGDNEIEVQSTDGFYIGDLIQFGSTGEIVRITGINSIHFTPATATGYSAGIKIYNRSQKYIIVDGNDVPINVFII